MTLIHPTSKRSRVLAGARWLAERATNPLLPGDFLDLYSPLRRGATSLRGKVVGIRRETPDASSLEILPGQDWRGHRPGQYVRIGVDVDGVRRWRAYSLTSHTDAPTVTITPKAIPNGLVSNHLVRDVAVGDLLHLDQALGDFSLPDPLPAKVLFVTAGSGITPVMGMLRNHLDDLRDVVLVHSSPTAEDVVFGAELRQYAAAGHLRLVERHTHTAGILEMSGLAGLVPDWLEREAWVCGPAGLLQAAESHWENAEAADRLHTERFRPLIHPVVGDGGQVTFGRTGLETEADAATPLLEVGESAGVPMPSGCRMGICFGCVAPLRSGAVRDLRTGALTTATPDDIVQIQTCVTAAAGACHIDL